MDERIKAIVIRFGLIAALVFVGYDLYGYFVDVSVFGDFWLGIMRIVAVITILFVGGLRAKSVFGGYISFRDVFRTIVLSGLIASLILTAVQIILFIYVDPDFATKINEAVVDNMVKMGEASGATPEQIAKQMETLKSSNEFTFQGLFQKIMYSILGYSLLGLFSALILKKEKPITNVNPAED